MSSTSTTKTNTSLKIDDETKLADLPFFHQAMVIEQAFSLLCWQSGQLPASKIPATVKALSQAANLPLDVVINRLTNICRLSEGIFLKRDDLAQQTKPLFLHLDQQQTHSDEFSQYQSLALDDLEAFFSIEEKNACIIVVGANAPSRYSAALALREKGILSAYVLEP